MKIKEQVLQENISDENKKLIEDTKVYTEGISVLFIIKDVKDLEDIKAILDIRDN